MEHIRSYFVSVCFAIVFCAVISVMIPGKKFEKLIQIVLGIFIVGMLVKPMSRIINYDFATSQAFSYDLGEIPDSFGMLFSKSDFEDAVYKSSAKAIKTQIMSELKNMNVEYKNVTIEIDKDKMGICLAGIDPGDKDRISSYIKKNFGVEPEMTE